MRNQQMFRCNLFVCKWIGCVQLHVNGFRMVVSAVVFVLNAKGLQVILVFQNIRLFEVSRFVGLRYANICQITLFKHFILILLKIVIQFQIQFLFQIVQINLEVQGKSIMSTLYQRLGGEEAISAVVDKFYEFMLADPITGPFFQKTDMKRQGKMQKNFITMATGGPNNYTGADMKTAHAKLKIAKREFDQTWNNLERSLNFFEVPQTEQDELRAVFYSVEAQCVTVHSEGQIATQTINKNPKTLHDIPSVASQSQINEKIEGKTGFNPESGKALQM